MSERSAEKARALTAQEREALARITGGHVKPFNHHPCITCAVQAEVERLVVARLTAIEWYIGKEYGYLAETYERAVGAAECPSMPPAPMPEEGQQ